MPILIYWGEDDFALNQAVTNLQKQILDPTWTSFNYDKITNDRSDGITIALNQAMTPPLGMGGRFIWLVDTTLTYQCSESLLVELERTLPVIPPSSTLLLTSKQKPDARLKSTKLLQKYATIKEFSLIPPWKLDDLIHHVNHVAQELGIKLTTEASKLLAESVGNQTRQLYSELEKLQLLKGDPSAAITGADVLSLVVANTQNSLQLAEAIRSGDTGKALGLISNLINHNEPALKIVATLVGQFRTWLWIKIMLESGEKDDQVIAKAADLGNPKRLFFMKKELVNISSQKLAATLPILLELEWQLKRGGDPLSTLQEKAIELCQVMKIYK